MLPFELSLSYPNYCIPNSEMILALGSVASIREAIAILFSNADTRLHFALKILFV
jgi:hypothetical protein